MLKENKIIKKEKYDKIITLQKPNLNLNLLAYLNNSKIQIIDITFKNYFKIISNDKLMLNFDNIISITDKIYLILAKSFCSAIPSLLLVEFGKDEKNNYQIIKFDDKDIININDKILDIFTFKQKIEGVIIWLNQSDIKKIMKLSLAI